MSQTAQNSWSLTREEFSRLTPQEKMSYLARAILMLDGQARGMSSNRRRAATPGDLERYAGQQRLI
jgi:hypothetical protein